MDVSDAVQGDLHIILVVAGFIDGHHAQIVRVEHVRRVVGVYNTVHKLDRGIVLVNSEKVDHLLPCFQLGNDVVHGLVNNDRLGEGDLLIGIFVLLLNQMLQVQVWVIRNKLLCIVHLNRIDKIGHVLHVLVPELHCQVQTIDFLKLGLKDIVAQHAVRPFATFLGPLKR